MSYVPGASTFRCIAFPQSLSHYVVPLRCFLTIVSHHLPFGVLLTADSFYATPLLLIRPTFASLSLCFSFATLCIRVKTIFLCLPGDEVHI